MAMSSAIADSSSTTTIWLMVWLSSSHEVLDGVHGVVAHVGALDDVDDLLGQVLGMVAHALDGLGHEHQIDRRRDGAWVLHHVGDQFAQQAVEQIGRASCRERV